MIKHLKKVKKGVAVGKSMKDDPLGFLLDRLLVFLVNCFIPIPFIGELVAMYKMQFLFFLLLLLVMVLTIFLTFGDIILNVPNGMLPNSVSATTNFIQGVFNASDQKTADKMKSYRENGFSDTDTPTRNPFAGQGMENTYTTVDYGEVENLDINGSPYHGVEEGIDLVPSSHYYATNTAYALTEAPIIFDTLTGTTSVYTDQFGANIVEVTNSQGTIKTVYIHMKQVLTANNTLIHAGQPIGVMGSTGLSTGDHLEYQVRLNQGGSWVTVNPIGYIQ